MIGSAIALRRGVSHVGGCLTRAVSSSSMMPMGRPAGRIPLAPSSAGSAGGKSLAAASGLATPSHTHGSPSSPPSSHAFHTMASALAYPGTVVPFKLADIGEGIAEAQVLKWFVKPGDKIDQFDKVCEVQSDKATVEISSRYAGVVKKLYYQVNDMAKVGSVLLDIEAAAEAAGAEATHVPAAAASSSSSSSSPLSSSESFSTSNSTLTSAPPSAVSTDGSKTFATPAVRRLVKEHGLDIAAIRGTGKDGRVLKEDVLNHVAAASSPRAPATATATATATAIATAAPQTPAAPSRPAAPTGADRVEPIRGFSRAMVKSMTAANQIPHFSYCDEIVMNRLKDFRSGLKAVAESRGVKLTYMPIFIKAASLALARFPVLNSSVNADCTEITYKYAHNIGVAMDTPNGLIVPNIKNVQDKSIFEVAAELNRLQTAGANGQLRTEDLTGGTFTLSNIGTVGGTYMKPILVVPEVVIGAIGKIQKLPRFDENDNVYAAHIMQVSWSADHRIIDGVTMAKFSNLWKGYIENPESMIVDLR